MEAHLEEKYGTLVEIIKSIGKACIAYSGGVDSSLLVKVCADTLDTKKILAVTGVSEIFTPSEAFIAGELARSMGVRCTTLKTAEMKDHDFLKNDGDRCYHCRSGFYRDLVLVARAHGFAVIIDGSNLDDREDYRPGRRAAEEFGIRSPLLDAGMGKEDVRALSRELGVPGWDRPANPCLASRIPYGTPITKERLDAVEKSEEFIRSLGFKEVRVRHHDDIARIEIPIPDMARFLEKGCRELVEHFIKGLGFKWVSLDLGGYRMGSLNSVLPAEGGGAVMAK
ncbi:MAG: ATP-dependent sacrificial sulfur transferase LarE [Chrysiogenales bacterium]|nr:MAG: ATP-dependent sacrificial sulfur transferase LarE [Chrysiogenales bacterium]